ncbi:MAG: hypothetical protein AAF919_08275 [Pseudomonadota bacterium]
MRDGPLHLLLDSLAIGIVIATLALGSLLVLDPAGTGRMLADLGPWLLTLIWLHVAVTAAPFGTLFLLARNAD